MALNAEAQRVQQLMASLGSKPGSIQDNVSPEDYFLLQKHGFVSSTLPVGAKNPWDTANGGGGSEAMGKILMDQRNALAQPPTNQPPASATSPIDTSSGRGSTYNALTGGRTLTSPPTQNTGAKQLPAGFNLRTGSTDPLDPTGQNKLVYGDNYFPGGLPGFEGIANAQQFAALTPEQQGSYREALYLANQRAKGLGPQPGGVVPGLPGDPYGVQEPGSNNKVGPGGVWQPDQGTGVPGWNPKELPPPAGPSTPPPAAADPREDPFQRSPLYDWQIKQGTKELSRYLKLIGRYRSTHGANEISQFTERVGAAEADKQYMRTFDQQRLGLQAALAQAQADGYSGQQLANLAAQLGAQLASQATNYGNNQANLIGNYGNQQQNNILNFGQWLAQAYIATAAGQQPLTLAGGNTNSQFYQGLGALPVEVLNYLKNIGVIK